MLNSRLDKLCISRGIKVKVINVSLLTKYPLVRVEGTNFEMGYQLGKTCVAGIRSALMSMKADVYSRGLDPNKAVDSIKDYIPYHEEYAPDCIEELKGLSKGAHITINEALFLQLRFEMALGWATECTTFLLSGDQTPDGHSVLGHNIDYLNYAEPSGILISKHPEDGPAQLMYAYAPGMIGYMGINSKGLGINGNAIYVGDWHVGVGRYVLVHQILKQQSIEDAIKVVERAKRASSIGFGLTDSSGKVKYIEISPDEVAVIEPQDNLIVHANTCVHPDMIKKEKEQVRSVRKDSPIRLEAMRHSIELLKTTGKNFTVENLMNCMKNHENFPKAICRHESWDQNDPHMLIKTICSLIQKPSALQMWVAVGNPCKNDYNLYYV